MSENKPLLGQYMYYEDGRYCRRCDERVPCGGLCACERGEYRPNGATTGPQTTKPEKTAGQLMIYLAGPMTGRPNNNYPTFNFMANRLRDAGLKIINPAELDAEESAPLSWSEYLRRDVLRMLSQECNAMALLPQWEHSRGVCKIELPLAAGFRWSVFCAVSLLSLMDRSLRELPVSNLDDARLYPPAWLPRCSDQTQPAEGVTA